MKKIYTLLFLLTILFNVKSNAQTQADFYTIINQVSEERIKADITTLANFGTRHTLSDTLSQSRGSEKMDL